MISWRIFSSTVEKLWFPQRLAGTMKMYSKKAMPQLRRTTFHKGITPPPLSWLYFKCPYQAKVMKMFEMTSKAIGVRRDWVKAVMGWFVLIRNGVVESQILNAK